MFHYFGYGSNLRRESLRAKSVEVRSAEPAVLENWRLVFNIAHPFPMEGSVASIVPAANGVVHGALCSCDDQYLSALDRFEGIGEFYERRQLRVRTYRGVSQAAFVYVGLPARTGAEARPSRRYRNIIIEGARDVGLADHYIDWLENLTVHPAPDYPPFVPPEGPAEIFTPERLAAQPLHTALLGHVFDMSEAREVHVILRTLLGGRDATAFFLQRMDTGPGTETDIARGQLSTAQRHYLNAYLHEFAREYRYAGRLP